MINTNITIIGAGLVGMTMARALVKNGFSVAVVEAEDINTIRKKESDGRTSAIAAGSAQIFKEIGVWDEMQPHACEIKDITVSDGNSPTLIHYDHQLLGKEPLGYIVENYWIREALFASSLRGSDCDTRAAGGKQESDEAIHLKNNSEWIASSHSLRSAHRNDELSIHSPRRYTSITFSDSHCTVTLDNGETIQSSLLIAADGKNSSVRKLAGIRTHNWDYGQSGIVCTIAHENHHQYIAQERFLPEGPFAVLPMEGGYHSSLVWTEKNHLVPTYLAMKKEEIEDEITARAEQYLGNITLASRMYSYPLSLYKAKRYVSKRLALIGDAAHSMHPLAGQGFNVGIRDVAALTKLIINAAKLGQDIGSDALLSEYEKQSFADSISLLTITDLLNRSFSNNIFPLKLARRLSMSAVDKTLPLKKFFMKHAMGVE